MTINSLHGSDSVESANRELEFFFGINTPLKVLTILLSQLHF